MSPWVAPCQPVAPPLSDTLDLLLPPDDLTRVLRACLLSGSAVTEAWERWLHLDGRSSRLPPEDGNRIKRLSPLLADNLRRNGVPLGRDWQAYLGAALIHGELRSARYWPACQNALSALRDAGVAAILLRGAALAQTVYPRPSLRHCHDIDVLVPAADLDGAIDALAAAGWRNPAHPRAADARILQHGSRLPIRLHLALFRVPFHDVPTEHVRQRTRRLTVGGVPTSILAAPDMLVHVCGHAATDRSRETLVWACDAALLVRRHPDLDWSVVADVTLRSQAALPVWVMLTYVARHLEAAVPAWVLEDLRRAAMSIDAVRRQSALGAARASHRGGFVNLWRASGWRSRLSLVRWALAPSPSYLRWSCAPTRPWTLPVWYIRRPLRSLARLLGTGQAPSRAERSTASATKT